MSFAKERLSVKLRILTQLNGGRSTEWEEGWVLVCIVSTLRHNKQGILTKVGRREGYLVIGKYTKRQDRRKSLELTICMKIVVKWVTYMAVSG